jgi:hypothetical protein
LTGGSSSRFKNEKEKIKAIADIKLPSKKNLFQVLFEKLKKIIALGNVRDNCAYKLA